MSGKTNIDPGRAVVIMDEAMKEYPKWEPLDEGVSARLLPHAKIDASGTYAAFGHCFDDNAVTKIYGLRDRNLRLTVDMRGTTHMRARFQDGKPIVTDDRGRVLIVNVDQGKVVSEWRI